MEDLLSYGLAREAGELGLKLQRAEVKPPSYLWKYIGNKGQLRGENMPQTHAGLPSHEDIHQILKFQDAEG